MGSLECRLPGGGGGGGLIYEIMKNMHTAVILSKDVTIN